MEKEYAVLLPGDNSEPKIVEFKGDQSGVSLQWCYEQLGCDFIDIVRTIAPDRCLIVDYEGLMKPEPSVNIPASLLYGVQDHGQPIVGSALVCADKHTPDGTYTVGLPKEEAEFLLNLLAPYVGKED